MNGLSRINISNKTSSYFSENEGVSTTRRPVDYANTGEDKLTTNIENMQLNSDNTNLDYQGKEIR